MNGVRLLTRYLATGVKAQMQYPASTLLLAAGQFAANLDRKPANVQRKRCGDHRTPPDRSVGSGQFLNDTERS